MHRAVLFNGGTRRQDSSSLESGVVGVPPPILRRIGTFTAAEVERILAERDKEVGGVVEGGRGGEGRGGEGFNTVPRRVFCYWMFKKGQLERALGMGEGADVC